VFSILDVPELYLPKETRGVGQRERSSMATITRRQGKWRAQQVSRRGYAFSKTFDVRFGKWTRDAHLVMQ
jgi:hypothetical protein